jgi:hypothetical protein
MDHSGPTLRLIWLLKKFKIRRPFQNGEMQGSEKIQAAQCIVHT